MNVNALKLIDPGFPLKLKQISDRPKQLFYRGEPPEKWSATPAVAIVGSRKLSAYGQRVTEQLASRLAKRGLVIISGLAYGVDAWAHRAAVEAGGQTVAVLPGGAGDIYPRAHRQLAQQIIDGGGALIWEYPSGTEVMKHSFIARNRLISGLADVVLVTQAAGGSGSLHTANFGLEQGKSVMAVPGPIDDPNQQGCNQLIKAGAEPVTSVEDTLNVLNLPIAAPKTRRLKDPRERLIYELLAKGVDNLEELNRQAKLDAASLSQTLTALEISGDIRPLGAGRWRIS